MGSLANSLVSLLTGSSISDISAQASAAEQNIILAVEAGLIMMAIIIVELFILIRNTSKG